MTPFTLFSDTRSKRRIGRILASLFVGFCLLAITLNLLLPHGSSAAASTIILNPDADASVKQSNPTKASPNSNQLLVAGGGNPRQSFLRFTLTGIPDGAALQSARLRLVVTNGSANGGIISSLSNTDWPEELNWDSRPAVDGPQLAELGAVEKDQVVEVDLMSVINGNGAYGFAITTAPDNGNTVGYASRENNNADKRPQLVVTLQGDAALPPQATAEPQPTAEPEATSQPEATAEPQPTAQPAAIISLATATGGIWISPAQISALPMSGSAWSAIQKIADSDIGTANMSDQDSQHPKRTLAVALAAVRTGNEAYRTKAVNEIIEVIGTENNPDPNCSSPKYGARGLAVGRNLIAYVIAADVLNLRSGGYDPSGKGTQFQKWVDQIRHRNNCDNNGGTIGIAIIDSGACGSNGCSMMLASRIAAAAYLKDRTDVDKAWLIFRRICGDKTANVSIDFNSYGVTWQYNNNAPLAINPKGAKTAKTGYPADGVIVNDQGRGGVAPSDPNTAPGYTQYPWEGLQGMYASAMLFDRLGYKDPLGKSPWHMSDDALLRAVQYQWALQSKFGGSWYDSSRAAWVKHLAYYIYGFKPIQYNLSGGGRNLDYTQWTHPRS